MQHEHPVRAATRVAAGRPGAAIATASNASPGTANEQNQRIPFHRCPAATCAELVREHDSTSQIGEPAVEQRVP